MGGREMPPPTAGAEIFVALLNRFVGRSSKITLEQSPERTPESAMNFLILGNGPEELAWARTLAERPEHQLWAAFPGFKEFPYLKGEVGKNAPPPDEEAEEFAGHAAPRRDFEDALATEGVEAAIVGGPPEFRAEALRRAAAAGWPVVCLHPPGDDSEAYYQVALSRAETGAIIVPDIPLRLHPGVAAMRRALRSEELGPFRGLRLELPSAGDLARYDFARAVDVVRAVLGEIAALTATGDPPGQHPTESLVVQLRGPHGQRAEIRFEPTALGPGRIVLAGASASLTLEFDPAFHRPARLIRRSGTDGESVTELDSWDPRTAILDTLMTLIAKGDAHPDLQDGTRAMELAEATVRSLRRGRTIDLHYEEISEEGTFKSVMTSVGCVILVAILLVLPLAMIGPVVGFPQTIYIAYAIPPLLVGFILMQLLKLGIRKPSPDSSPPHKPDDEQPL